MRNCPQCARRLEVPVTRERLVPIGRVSMEIVEAAPLLALARAQGVSECEAFDQLLGAGRLPLVDSLFSYNKVVAKGRRYIGDCLRGVPPPTHVAVGTDNTAPVDGDTALVAEVFRDVITQRLAVTDGARLRFFLPSTAANGNTLREAAVFGPQPGSTILSRVTYSDIVKNSTIAVNYTWEIVFSEP
ncbi:hypothetical protein [Candidatus Nitronereus thalassa]|uniref:Uncharacterized protein n=1 Tax=Candidatus Nitronereus thalassa TaxID=3020898 RepID=A0ABU3K3C6_9BACT|nr:hypothetical protein [Candidatus Nitronereus thalassa]MDT7040882.1 hypothetical protein [Candidatus Nitronereus thalassa]